MDRREFLRTTIDATLLAAVATSAAAAARAHISDSSITTLLSLYDPRFDGARDAAVALGRGSEVRPVSGDFTDALMDAIAKAQAAPYGRVVGVTTEHVPFCLQGLIRPAHHGRVVLRRLDRDLFTWHFSFRGRAI